MEEKPRFIRKNGKIIPIRDSKNKGDRQMKRLDKKISKGNKKAAIDVASGAAAGGILAKAAGKSKKTALIAAAGGALVGGITSRFRKDVRAGEKAKTKKADLEEARAWERKRKDYAKMNRKKR